LYCTFSEIRSTRLAAESGEQLGTTSDNLFANVLGPQKDNSSFAIHQATSPNQTRWTRLLLKAGGENTSLSQDSGLSNTNH
jgi:hypothetical protein